MTNSIKCAIFVFHEFVVKINQVKTSEYTGGKMSKQKTSSNYEQRKKETEFGNFDTTLKLLDSTINLYEITRKRLILTRDTPHLFEIFSSKEVQEFNLKEREIPGMIEAIIKLKKSTNIDNHGEPERNKQIQRFRKKQEELSEYIDILWAKIPEPKSSLGEGIMLWILRPIDSLTNLLHKIKHPFVMAYLGRESERQKRRRRRLENEKKSMKKTRTEHGKHNGRR